MEPLLQSGTQDWLKLDAESAVRNSPIRHIPRKGCPFIGVVGRDEPDAFVRQTMDFCAAWAAAGHPVEASVAAGQHHFSIIGELGRAESPVFAAIGRMKNLS
jgi:arylformamidase